MQGFYFKFRAPVHPLKLKPLSSLKAPRLGGLGGLPDSRLPACRVKPVTAE